MENCRSEYRNLFEECIADDDKIDADERHVLEEKATGLGLTPDEVEQIESKVRVKFQSSLFALRSPEEKIRIKKAKTLLLKICDFKNAYEELKKLSTSLRKDKEVTGLYVMSAIAYKPEEALSILYQNYRTDTPRKSFLRICALEALGEDSEASEELKKSLHIFPDDPYLKAKTLERLTDLYLSDEQEDDQLDDMREYFEELALPKDSSDPYLSFVIFYYRMSNDESFTVKDMLDSLREPYHAQIKSNVRDMVKSLSKKKEKDVELAKLIDMAKESSNGDGLSLSDVAELLDCDENRAEMLLLELTESGRLEKWGEDNDCAWFLNEGSDVRTKKIIKKSPLVPADSEKPSDDCILLHNDINMLYQAALRSFRDRNFITRRYEGHLLVIEKVFHEVMDARTRFESWMWDGIAICGFAPAHSDWSTGFVLSTEGLYVKEDFDRPAERVLGIDEVCTLKVSKAPSFEGILIGDYKLRLPATFNSEEALLFFKFFQKVLLKTLEYSRKLQLCELCDLKDKADILSKPRYESAYRDRLKELESIFEELVDEETQIDENKQNATDDYSSYNRGTVIMLAIVIFVTLLFYGFLK